MRLVRRSTTLASSLALVGLASGCATYTSKTESFRANLYGGNSSSAITDLDKTSVASSKSDKLVYLFERGMANYIGLKYKEATGEWEKASRQIEELYSVSASRTAGSFVVSENVTEYEGEAHERVLLPVFSALAYLAANQPNEAIVEARRTAKVLEKLSEENGKKGKYSQDGFAHLLAGIVFEMKRNWDDALIEYRRALEATESNRGWASRIQARSVVEALGRLAEFRRRSDLTADLEKKYPSITWKKQSELDQKAEILVVYEAGRSPLKRTEDMMIPTSGAITRISFPVYYNEYYASQGATIFVNAQNEGRTEIVEDIGALARQALSDRKGAYIAKLTARAIAKAVIIEQTYRKLGILAGLGANVAALVTEVADTRSWTSLPDLIGFSRVVVPAETDLQIKIAPDVGQPLTARVRLLPGEKRLLRLRTFQ
jgi:hypothetical protein